MRTQVRDPWTPLCRSYLGPVEPLQLLLLGLSPGSFLDPPGQLGVQLFFCVGFLVRQQRQAVGGGADSRGRAPSGTLSATGGALIGVGGGRGTLSLSTGRTAAYKPVTHKSSVTSHNICYTSGKEEEQLQRPDQRTARTRACTYTRTYLGSVRSLERQSVRNIDGLGEDKTNTPVRLAVPLSC